MEHSEFSGFIVNHHTRCVANHEQQVKVLNDLGINPSSLKTFSCICKTLPTTEELNEALKVIPR